MRGRVTFIGLFCRWILQRNTTDHLKFGQNANPHWKRNWGQNGKCKEKKRKTAVILTFKWTHDIPQFISFANVHPFLDFRPATHSRSWDIKAFTSLYCCYSFLQNFTDAAAVKQHRGAFAIWDKMNSVLQTRICFVWCLTMQLSHFLFCHYFKKIYLCHLCHDAHCSYRPFIVVDVWPSTLNHMQLSNWNKSRNLHYLVYCDSRHDYCCS